MSNNELYDLRNESQKMIEEAKKIFEGIKINEETSEALTKYLIGILRFDGNSFEIKSKSIFLENEIVKHIVLLNSFHNVEIEKDEAVVEATLNNHDLNSKEVSVLLYSLLHTEHGINTVSKLLKSSKQSHKDQILFGAVKSYVTENLLTDENNLYENYKHSNMVIDNKHLLNEIDFFYEDKMIELHKKEELPGKQLELVMKKELVLEFSN